MAMAAIFSVLSCFSSHYKLVEVWIVNGEVAVCIRNAFGPWAQFHTQAQTLS